MGKTPESKTRAELYDERLKNQRAIEHCQTELTQLEHQHDRLLRREKGQDRKQRTRRLIERGALLESFLSEPERLTNEQVKDILVKWSAK